MKSFRLTARPHAYQAVKVGSPNLTDIYFILEVPLLPLNRLWARMNKLVKSLGNYSTRILLTFCLLSTASSWASVVSLQSGEIQDMVAVDQGSPAFSFKTDHT
ncbi:MAG: hypothetical protein ACPH15_00950, partial [Pseudomonadales bacterium]